MFFNNGIRGGFEHWCVSESLWKSGVGFQEHNMTCISPYQKYRVPELEDCRPYSVCHMSRLTVWLGE